VSFFFATAAAAATTAGHASSNHFWTFIYQINHEMQQIKSI